MPDEYDGDFSVILRSPESRQIVLFHSKTGSLSLANESQSFCALCGQPTHHSTVESGQEENEETSQNRLALSPGYFRMLAADYRFKQPRQRKISFSATESLEAAVEAAVEAPVDNAPLEDSFNQGYYDRFFVEEKKLGRGQRGSVYLVQHVIDGIPLGQYAVKTIPCGESHSFLSRMLQEVNLLESLNQQDNIVRYHHAWLEHRQLSVFAPVTSCLFILMEFCDGGNLEEYIRIESDKGDAASLKRRFRHRHAPADDCCWLEGGVGASLRDRAKKVRYLTDNEIHSLFMDTVRGLAHLHHNGIIHRDLKPSNLLLRFSSGTPKIMISDFGECQLISTLDSGQRRTGATGTLEFVAPELLRRNAEGQFESTHSLATDIWSLGVVLYFLCYSDIPYTNEDDVDLLKDEILHFKPLQMRFDNVKRVSQHKRDLIRALMHPAASSRPTVQSILDALTTLPSSVEAVEPSVNERFAGIRNQLIAVMVFKWVLHSWLEFPVSMNVMLVSLIADVVLMENPMAVVALECSLAVLSAMMY